MNRRITKEYAAARLQEYYDAEQKLLVGGQRIKLYNREVQRITMQEIRDGIRYWENVLAALETGQNPNAPRAVRVVPRDL